MITNPIGFYGNSVYVYLAETLTLVNRFSVPPSTALKQLIDYTIGQLKTNGLWSKLELLYVMNIHDHQAACQNWIANNFNLTEVGTPTFTAKSGFTGGVAKYLKTGWIAANSSLFVLAGTSTHFQMFQVPIVTSYPIFGAQGSASPKYAYLTTYTTGNDRYYLMSTSYIGNMDIQNNNFYSYVTSGANNYSYLNGGSKQTGSYTKSALPDVEMALVGLNANGVFSGYTTGMMNWMAGSTMADADVSNLYTIINYFNTHVGSTF